MASVASLPTALNPLLELQNAFGLMVLAGEVRIVDRHQIAAVLSGSRAGDVSFYKRADGELLMARALETLPVACKPREVIADFRVSPATHVYDAVAFSPETLPPTTLNYWVPPPVKPLPGDWSIIKEFLRDVICAGDPRLFKYLCRYIAHMVQHPEEKPGVMLVLLGGQGTGKGTFFAMLRSLWPRTTLQISDMNHVIGRFNAVMERNYAICMDEALFHGDLKALDRLKSLVSERHIVTEQKNQPVRSIESFHRFFAASNHKHFAKVELDDRRFVFLRVSDARKGDLAYFKGVYAALNDPDVMSAMMADLMAMDLSGFDVRRRPKTQEHTQQKLKSLDGFDRYWSEVLQTGDFSGDAPHAIEKPWTTGIFVSTHGLKSKCANYLSRTRQYDTLRDQDVGEALKKWCPGATPARRKVHRDQQRGYDLPPLSVARQSFESALGGPVEWHDLPEEW